MVQALCEGFRAGDTCQTQFPVSRKVRLAGFQSSRSSIVAHPSLDGQEAVWVDLLQNFPRESAPGEVVVYFADDPPRIYQLRQWLPVFERLDARRPVLVVTRHPETYDELSSLTTLRRVLTPSFRDLMALYQASAHKAAIYVNNSVWNFDSLASRSMVHIHVNHGESDKVCMVSNQAKAYDWVFVAGEAAVCRHRAALPGFDASKLIRIGRPQLDLRPQPVLPPSQHRTILYAPTWEGEENANDYTSIDVYGPAIVAAALAVPDARVVYKPHPRVATTRDPGVEAGHREIVRLLEQAAHRHPAAGHRTETTSDILAIFPGCDLMITDVSSVGLDFLYLHTDKPLFITDRCSDRERLHANAPVSRCADIVDAGSLGVLTHALSQRLAIDEHRVSREALREFYFGDLGPGECTERFLTAVEETVATRDRPLGSPTAADVQVA